MYESSDLRTGLKIEIDGDPYVIVQFEFVKPGKGQALYKCRLKNMVTGSQFDKTYRSGEKVKEANLEAVEMEYLYFDGNTYCFMNSSNYEQEFLSEEQVGDAKAFHSGAGRVLLSGPYASNVEVDTAPLLALCERWIKQLPTKGAA